MDKIYQEVHTAILPLSQNVQIQVICPTSARCFVVIWICWAYAKMSGNAKKGNIERTNKEKCLKEENQANLYFWMIFKLFQCALKFLLSLIYNQTAIRW